MEATNNYTNAEKKKKKRPEGKSLPRSQSLSGDVFSYEVVLGSAPEDCAFGFSCPRMAQAVVTTSEQRGIESQGSLLGVGKSALGSLPATLKRWKRSVMAQPS